MCNQTGHICSHFCEWRIRYCYYQWPRDNI